MHHQSKFKPCGLQPNHRTFGTSEYAPAPPSSGPSFRWSPCVRSTHPAARPSNHAHAGWEQVGWGSWEAVAALGDHWAALPAARVRKSIQAAYTWCRYLQTQPERTAARCVEVLGSYMVRPASGAGLRIDGAARPGAHAGGATCSARSPQPARGRQAGAHAARQGRINHNPEHLKRSRDPSEDGPRCRDACIFNSKHGAPR